MSRYVACWCIWLILLISQSNVLSSSHASHARGRDAVLPSGVAEAWLEHSLLTAGKAIVGAGGLTAGDDVGALPGDPHSGPHATCGFVVHEKLFAGQSVVIGDVFYPRGGSGRPLLRPLLAHSPPCAEPDCPGMEDYYKALFQLAYYGHFVDFNHHVSAMASAQDVALLYHYQHTDAWVSGASCCGPGRSSCGRPGCGRPGASAGWLSPPPPPPPLQGLNIVNLLACMGRGPELALVLQALWRLEPHHVPEVAW
jgi:hypothetical protein